MENEKGGGNQSDGGNKGNEMIVRGGGDAAEVSLLNFPSEKQIAEYSTFLKNFDNFVNDNLREGSDFGKIPGVDKPTLLKPGAEKLEKLFFLRNEKEMVEKVIDEGYAFVKYTYRTSIYNKSGQLVSTCEGTCNSHEKKYRYSTVYPDKATEAEKQAGKLETRKSRNGGTYQVYVIEKKDFHDIENTIMKMAQKRSFVGAILEATNSSGRFTQDVEDITPEDPARGQDPGGPRSSVAPHNDPSVKITRAQMNYLFVVMEHAKVTKERFEEVILKTYNVKGIEALPKYIASKIIDDLIKKYGEPQRKQGGQQGGQAEELPVVQLEETEVAAQGKDEIPVL